MDFPDHRLALYRGIDSLKAEILSLASAVDEKKKLRRIYRHLAQDWGCHYPPRKEQISLMTHSGRQAVAFELLPIGVQRGVTLQEWGCHNDDLLLKKRDGYPTDDEEDVIDGEEAVVFQRGKTPKGIASYVMVSPDWEVVSLADTHHSKCPSCSRLRPTILRSDPYSVTGPAAYFLCCCNTVHDIAPESIRDPHKQFLERVRQAYLQTLVSYAVPDEKDLSWIRENDAQILLPCRPRHEGSPYRGHPEDVDPRECVRFLDLLRRTVGPEPEGTRLVVGSYIYDGTFQCRARTTACLFTTQEGHLYARRCRDEAPTTWEG